jgi:multimeric flavodoxin WrbA
MKRTLVLVGSPRGKKSTSTSLGKSLMDLFEKKGLEVEILWLNRQVKNEEGMAQLFEAIDRADIVVLTAPLYDDCQPSIVARAMEAIAGQKMSLENKRFIPIINCGFPEPEQITAVAIDIYHKFAKTTGFRWGGSLAIGGGEMLRGVS